MNARILGGSLAALLLAVGCRRSNSGAVDIPSAAVERRDIVIDATASGTIEPINVVEVKSKSSGQITRMPVETGSIVNPGDLLVQLDTRDVRNQYDQAKADLNAAEARLGVGETQKKRSDELFQQRIITAQEHEAAQLDFANAQAAVVRARTSADIALQRLEDATVKAPIYGTVIEKTVSLGQVIASATNSVTGGTTILRMADLGQVRMRALFNETDIGSVQPGQEATVTVDAYPDRPFRGSVEKIEPQAVVQQSVTMFPVLVTLANREGLLKPGMTGEGSVLVDRREAVLAVPNDAVRNLREGAATAVQLGLDADSVQAQIQAQMAQSLAGAGFGNGAARSRPQSLGGATPADARRESRGEVALADAPQDAARQQLPEVSEAQCAAVRAAFAKQPDTQGKLQAVFQRMRAGELDMQQMRGETEAIYKSLGVDGRVARACQMRERGGGATGTATLQAGAGAGTQTQTERRAPPPPAASGERPNEGREARQGRRTDARQPGSSGAAAAPVAAGEFPVRTRARPDLVFISDSGTYKPRVVRVGASNLDYTEVVSGLNEGERVALLAVAAAAAQRAQQNDRMRSMTGGGVPGMKPGPGAGGGRPRP
ncbi:MAG: efflux RND transporter periplasmic adaptor subunit [Gemmatimonadaceae bacterium]